jgi:hypothetical protein
MRGYLARFLQAFPTGPQETLAVAGTLESVLALFAAIHEVPHGRIPERVSRIVSIQVPS